MAGAAGYVLKEVRGSDLVDGIRWVASGQSLLDPGVTEQVLQRLRSGPQEDPRLAALTGQDKRVLGLIAAGMSIRQIAADLCLAEKTVKNYVSSILVKLSMDRRTQAAVSLPASTGADQSVTRAVPPAYTLKRNVLSVGADLPVYP